MHCVSARTIPGSTLLVRAVTLSGSLKAHWEPDASGDRWMHVWQQVTSVQRADVNVFNKSAEGGHRLTAEEFLAYQRMPPRGLLQ